MKQNLKITVGIICKSKRHKISLTEQGKLVFHDHPEGFKEDSALVSLGGEPCKCYKVLLAWKKYAKRDRRNVPRGIIPEEFDKVRDEFFAKHKKRTSEKNENISDRAERKKKLIIYILTKLFCKSKNFSSCFSGTKFIFHNYNYWNFEIYPCILSLRHISEPTRLLSIS